MQEFKYNFVSHFQLGEKMKTQVHNALNADSNLRGKMVPWYNTAEGKKVFEELYKSNKEEFPDYMEELEGLAGIFILN